MLRRLRLILAVALVGTLTGCALFRPPGPSVKDTTKSFTTVVVDAGHGGKDNGAYRRYGGAEKVATLDVAKRLNDDLRESKMRTVMTRKEDVFIPLDERVRIGNTQKNAIFVSIHFNDSSRRAIHGYETYYHSPVSHNLAERIQSSLLTIPNSANRGVKTANFRVLRNSKYPSVLVECGFLSNRREGGEASDSTYRQLLADRIAEAIVDFRYGEGVYEKRTAARAPSRTPATREPTIESTGPGLAPSKLRP